jgi:hypothetical protein
MNLPFLSLNRQSFEKYLATVEGIASIATAQINFPPAIRSQN